MGALRVALLALLLPIAANAAPEIRIAAEVDPDLAWVRGTMIVRCDAPCALVDPLASLPDAPNDLFAARTFPGTHETGTVRFSRDADGVVSFFAILPRRWGDVGTTRHGLFANGRWYPQPLVDGTLPVFSWSVTVQLPPGTAGVLGDDAGAGTLHWRGKGERASLAVVKRGRVTPILVTDDMRRGPAPVSLLTQGRPRARLVKELSRQLAATAAPERPWRGTVVEAPLRRRLVRAGVDTAYVSDRAYRLTPGLQRTHRVAVTRGVMEGLLPIPDPWLRSLGAAGLSVHHARLLRGASAPSWLRWVSWIPTIDYLLHSETTPFVAEILERPFPGDPVSDDLVEQYAPQWPAPAVAAQLDDRYGPGTATVLAEGLAAGLSLDRAATLAGAAGPWVASLRSPYPVQDYTLDVLRDPPTVRVLRSAPDGAPEEPVVVRVDGVPSIEVLGPGPDQAIVLPGGRPRRVVIDPAGHTRQVSRVGDAWPRRYTLTLAGDLETINLTEGYVEASGSAWVRRTGDTHGTAFGSLATERTTWAAATLGYAYRVGPLQDGLARPYRFSAWASAALLNPNYAVADGPISVGGGLAWRWSSREASWFPLRGHRTLVQGTGGFVPGTPQTWASAIAAWTAVVSPHPRHAVGWRLGAGIARGDLPHRLLDLGGPANLRAIAAGEIIGTRRALAVAEYRIAAIRDLNVPALVVWGSEVHLAVGAEAGTVWDHGYRTAVGVTAGVLLLGDLLGADERAVRLTFAWPVWADGFTLERTAVPVTWLAWSHPL